jgi:hypothetical protein
VRAQYIRNESTARRGSFRKSLEGRAEIARRRSLTRTKDEGDGVKTSASEPAKEGDLEAHVVLA